MLSRAAGRNFGITCQRALSVSKQEDPTVASMEAVKEKDIRATACSNYRELSTHDKMNDYFIQMNDSYHSPDPVDPEKRQPLLENVVVSQYESEDASINLSVHMYPNVPAPGLAQEGLPYSWLNTRSFDSLRQAKFSSGRLLNAHQSRHYHSGRSLQGVQNDIPRGASPIAGSGVPQGVQGDGCVHYELWKQTCGALFSRCVPSDSQDGLSGRKTLSELFNDQLNAIESQRK